MGFLLLSENEHWELDCANEMRSGCVRTSRRDLIMREGLYQLPDFFHLLHLARLSEKDVQRGSNGIRAHHFQIGAGALQREHFRKEKTLRAKNAHRAFITQS
jgi:hypothetical protein